MNLADLIFERKSCRKYLDVEITSEEFEKIKEFISNAKALDDSIEFDYDFLTRKEIIQWKKCMLVKQKTCTNLKMAT